VAHEKNAAKRINITCTTSPGLALPPCAEATRVLRTALPRVGEARKPRALSTSALFVLKYASTPDHDKQAQSSTAPQRSKTERDCVGREAWPKVCCEAYKRQGKGKERARKGQGLLVVRVCGLQRRGFCCEGRALERGR
jgi:hypothetical protein